MKKYIVTYHAPLAAMKQTENTSSEDAAEGMKAWHEWAEKSGDHLVDLGSPLTDGQRIQQGKGSKPSLRQVCGYSILQAENIDHAKELLLEHPHLKWRSDCEIEIHEALPLPDANNKK